MTMFLDLRAAPSGGLVSTYVAVIDGATRKQLPPSTFTDQIRGRHVVLATHGFNVSSASGLRSLSNWDGLANLQSPKVFVGVLWPGDSRFLPLLDYPVEGAVANQAGELLAAFVDSHLDGAASLSMVSHSLGARLILETIRLANRRISTLILMAAAIEDDCLTQEYRTAVAKVERLRVVASLRDAVLALAFPIGNPFGEIVMRGHPFFRQALGRRGPSSAVGIPARLERWQIPTGWDYGHLDYLPGNNVDDRMPPPAIASPGSDDARPRAAGPWKPSWSAAVIGTPFDTA